MHKMCQTRKREREGEGEQSLEAADADSPWEALGWMRSGQLPVHGMFSKGLGHGMRNHAWDWSDLALNQLLVDRDADLLGLPNNLLVLL